MSDPWFKFYPSDWLSGTRGLTPAETGVYITLVCMMYENDGQLARPDGNQDAKGGAKQDTKQDAKRGANQDTRLARRCGCTSAAFKKILANLLAERKFIENNGFLTNERVQKELAERSNRIQKTSDAAHHKWSKTRGNGEQNQAQTSAPAYPVQSLGAANYQNQNQNKFNKKSSGFVKSETPLQRVSRELRTGQVGQSKSKHDS